jgi:hypothetical protein
LWDLALWFFAIFYLPMSLVDHWHPIHAELDDETGPALALQRIRLCYGFDGQLSTAFTTSPNSQRYLVTYRREGLERAA